MTDKHFLRCIHARLVHTHGEHELFDYMHRLRKIIISIDESRDSNNLLTTEDSLEELKRINNLK